MNSADRHVKERHIGSVGQEQDRAISIHTIYEELIELKSILQQQLHSEGKKVFNNKSLSQYLGVSTRTLQNWRDAGIITFVQVKDVILYSESDVESFLKKHKRIAFK